MSFERYRDRKDAGLKLAQLLSHYASYPDLLVLALPRGGIPIGDEIAKSLNAPLLPYVVRKLGVPGYSELAMGAIAPNGRVIFNDYIIKEMSITKEDIDAVIYQEKKELERREKLYLNGKRIPALKNKNIILVDDGIATGATIKAAIAAIKAELPAALIVAVPVCAEDSAVEIDNLVEDFICPLRPVHFNAVGEWYDLFDQVEDEEVLQIMRSFSNV